MKSRVASELKEGEEVLWVVGKKGTERLKYDAKVRDTRLEMSRAAVL